MRKGFFAEVNDNFTARYTAAMSASAYNLNLRLFHNPNRSLTDSCEASLYLNSVAEEFILVTTACTYRSFSEMRNKDADAVLSNLEACELITSKPKHPLNQATGYCLWVKFNGILVFQSIQNCYGGSRSRQDVIAEANKSRKILENFSYVPLLFWNFSYIPLFMSRFS